MALTLDAAYARLVSLPRGMSHSYLFYGAPSDDQESLVLRLSRYLFGDIDPLKHPDFLRIIPEGRSRVIPIDAVREIEGRLSQHSYEGGAKVVMLHEVERMGAKAANALLKTLEEPPGRSHLFLTCSAPDMLLPTIVSRCVQVPLFCPGKRSLTQPQIEAVLAFRNQLGEENRPLTTRALLLSEQLTNIAETQAASDVKGELALIKKLKKADTGRGDNVVAIREREELASGMQAARSKLHASLIVSAISAHLTEAYGEALKGAYTPGDEYYTDSLRFLEKIARGIESGANRRLLFETLGHRLLRTPAACAKWILARPAPGEDEMGFGLE